jgi:hypothetical protein
MIKSLAKFSAALAIVVSMTGCAAGAIEESSQEEQDIAAAQSALSVTAAKTGLLVQAFASPTGTQIDITTLSSFELDHDVLHAGPDQFRAVAIYAVSSTGATRLLAVFGGKAIGPGGGCIHFNGLPLNVGDVIRVGAVVSLPGTKGATVAASEPVTVLEGNSQFTN